jgi:hypothetical protein
MDFDAIWKRARNDLTVTTKNGDTDLFLWEHCVRVTQVAQRIAKLPAVQSHQPDEVATVAAGLYHDAGWAVRCRAGEIERIDVLLTPTTENLAEAGAMLMEQSLADLLSPTALERASHAIRTCIDREPDTIEAQLIAEANHLEEFGLLMLWQAIRKGMLEGKAVQAVIDTWRRRKEYQFWTARLKDSFRFKPIRDIAEQRLKTLERFMDELQIEHLGMDVSTTDSNQPLPRTAKPTVG